MENSTRPDIATRFKPGQSGNAGGRPSNALFRKILREAREDGTTAEESVIRHLIEVATKWQIMHFGETLDVASGRDSVEAAKVLLQYLWGKPREQPDAPVQPPMEVTEGMSLLDIAVATYRWRLLNGQMPVSEFHDMVKTIMSIDQAKVALVLKLMGKDSGKDAEEILRMLDKGRAQDAVVVPAVESRPEQPAPPEPPKEPDAG